MEVVADFWAPITRKVGSLPLPGGPLIPLPPRRPNVTAGLPYDRLPMLRIACLSLILCAMASSGPARAQDAGDVQVIPDVPYLQPTEGRPLTVDVFVPAGEGPRPALLVIPGGGWTPSERQERDLPLIFAQQGFVVFVPEYTPAGEAVHPTQVQELQTAVAWVRSHASEYGVDPARVAAMGGSAGGHLAAMLATWGDGPLNQGSRVRAAVSWSGPMDLTQLVASGFRGKTLDRLLGCSAPEDCEDAARDASPVYHLDATDAPLFLAHSLEDRVPFAQAEVMVEALGRVGVPYEFVDVPGAGHGSGLASNPDVLQPSVGFLREWLGIDDDGSLIDPPELSPSPSEEDFTPPQGRGGDQPRRGVGPLVVVFLLGAAALVAGLWVLLTRRLRG
jgi:acetyl esterase